MNRGNKKIKPFKYFLVVIDIFSIFINRDKKSGVASMHRKVRQMSNIRKTC